METLYLFFSAMWLYFLPTLVAISRQSARTRTILILNLFLGWTVIGWLVSLVWAFAVATAKMKKCPMCAEAVQPDALICRFCGTSFVTERAERGVVRFRKKVG